MKKSRRCSHSNKLSTSTTWFVTSHTKYHCSKYDPKCTFPACIYFLQRSRRNWMSQNMPEILCSNGNRSEGWCLLYKKSSPISKSSSSYEGKRVVHPVELQNEQLLKDDYLSSYLKTLSFSLLSSFVKKY